MLLAQRAKRSLLEWQPVLSRARPVIIVHSYAPTIVGKEGEEKERFYDGLQRTLDRLRKRDILIGVGDLNAKVREENQGLENIMGNYGIGTRNVTGEWLIDLSSSFALVI